MFKIIKNFLWRQKAAPYQATHEGYLPYFSNDCFPLEWHDIISKSPSASSCVSTISDFLEGNGFSDPDLNTLKVNMKGDTFLRVHHETSKSFSEYEGFYLLFKFDGAGKIVSIRVLPFESCRLGKPDDEGIISKIFYNPFFGTPEYASRRKDTIEYYTFDPNAVRAQIAKDQDRFPGQVLFVGTTTAASRFYPLPEAHSAVKWMKVEAGAADYHEDYIENGMLQPYMLVVKGDPNAPVGNSEEGIEGKQQTASEQFEEAVSENFQGAKRVGSVFVWWVNTSQQEETPEVIPLPSGANGDYFITVDNQATKKITVAFKVPAILANINEGVSLGGDGNMVRVAVKLMQQRVVKKQNLLTDVYEQILRRMAIPYMKPVVIVPYNPYPELETVDPQVWNAISEEEKRKWIQENTEIELIDDAPVVATPDQATQNKFSNALPVGFPEKIRHSIQKALDYDDKMGLKCSKRAGRAVAEAIVRNESMGQRQLKRIWKYLSARSDFENKGYDDCDAILYHQWGGKEMEKFLERELERIDKWLNKTKS
jgi:hypothetical protein